MRRLISETDDGFVLSLTDMQLSRGVITDEEYAAVREMISEIIGKNLPRKLSDLAVDGKTLMSIGYAGADIGREIAKLLDDVMRGRCENTAEELSERARRDRTQ